MGLVLTTCLTLSVLAAPPALASPSTGVPPVRTQTAPSPETAALAEARQTGQLVEVAGRTTETTKISAAPDGQFQAELSPVPVRVKRDGVFRDADLTLERQGGQVASRMSVNGVSFGAGGDDVLAAMVRDGKSLTLTWPGGKLPAPVLDGPAATYVDAGGAGIDVVVKSTPTGWSHYIVIRTAAAAQNPALAKIEFGVRTSGLRLQERSDNRVAAVDSTGKEVFTAPAPLMWDGGAAQTTRTAPEEIAAGPAPKAQVEAMQVEITEGKLALIPKRELLTSPTARLPIVLDPSWQTWNAEREPDGDGGSQGAGWAYVDKQWPNESYWKPDRLPTGREVEDNTDKRSYIRMDASKLHEWSGNVKVKVNDVFITFDTLHAWSCTARDVRLFNVGHIYSTTTWNSAPSAFIPEGAGWDTNWLSTASVKVGRPECGNDGSSNDVKFIDGHLTRLMQWATDHRWDFFTIGLFPDKDYDDTHTWKVLDVDPRMVVKFSRYPMPPADVHMLSGGTTKYKCVTGTNRPVVGWSKDRTLNAKITDYDGDAAGGALGQTLRAHYEVAPLGKPAEAVDKYTTYQKAHTDGYVHAAVTAPVDTASTTDGGTGWMWRVRGQDDTGLSGAWSSWCEYTVDTKRPNQPTVSATGYTEGQWGGYDAAARKYATGIFTLGASGSGDVVMYHYRFSDGTEKKTPVTAGTSLQVPWTPKKFGWQWVEVTAFDRAGNMSPTKKYEFGVEQPPRDAGWAMDETSGDRAKAVGDSGAARPAADVVFTGGAMLGQPGNQGHELDRAVRLNGTSQFGEVKPLLDGGQTLPLVDTSKRFMFSTWVKLAAVDRDQVAISQAAADGSVFELGWLDRRWTMRLRKADGTIPGQVKREMAQAGDGQPWSAHWVSLMGGYDPLTGEIWLRTQASGQEECSPDLPPGECEGSTPVMDPELAYTKVTWTPAGGTGSLMFGATTLGTGKAAYWNGLIDDSQLWPLARPDETVLKVIYGESVRHAEFDGSTLRLVNAGSGHCLEVTGAATTSGANVAQGTCNAGPAQNWKFTKVDSNGYYTLTNPNSGRCLDVDASDGSGTADGRNVRQRDCDGSDGQRWRADRKSIGFWLVSKLSGKCLAVADPPADAGSNVHQWTCANPLSNEQVWQITDRKRHELHTVTYRLRGAGSDRCLQPAEGPDPSKATMVQSECDDTPRQDWTFNYRGDGYYTLVNSSSQLCLAVAAESDPAKAKGMPLLQQPCSIDVDRQAWKVSAVGSDGAQGYRLFSKHLGLVAEVKEAAIGDGASVVQNNPTDSNPPPPHQTWKLGCLPEQAWRCSA